MEGITMTSAEKLFKLIRTLAYKYLDSTIDTANSDIKEGEAGKQDK